MTSPECHFNTFCIYVLTGYGLLYKNYKSYLKSSWGRPGSKPKSSPELRLSKVKRFYGDLEAQAQAVVRSQNGKDSRDPFLPYYKRLSHPVFPYASPLQYQYTLSTMQCQNLVASWILLQKLSGWAKPTMFFHCNCYWGNNKEGEKTENLGRLHTAWGLMQVSISPPCNHDLSHNQKSDT